MAVQISIMLRGMCKVKLSKEYALIYSMNIEER